MYKNYFMKTIFFNIYNYYQENSQNNIYEILCHQIETKILMNFL